MSSKAKLGPSSLIIVASLVLILAPAGYMATLWLSATSENLVGKEAPSSITVFMEQDDFSGEFFLILTDMYVEECNTRQNEIFNHMVERNEAESSTRILHTGKHGFPVKSLEEHERRKSGNSNYVLADSDVLYATASLKQLRKPCAIRLNDGSITEVLTGENFDAWLKDMP